MDTLIQLSHLSEEDLLCLSEKAAENLAIAFDSVQQEALQSSERLKQFETDHRIPLFTCSKLTAQFRIRSKTPA